MSKRDLAFVAIKIMGAYFFVATITGLAQLAFFQADLKLPGIDSISAIRWKAAVPSLVYGVAAVLMIWGTNGCLMLMGMPRTSDSN